jgi:hypothetical protein
LVARDNHMGSIPGQSRWTNSQEKAITPFTAFHTLLSLLPLGFGFVALVHHARIDSGTRLGKWYIWESGTSGPCWPAR